MTDVAMASANGHPSPSAQTESPNAPLTPSAKRKREDQRANGESITAAEQDAQTEQKARRFAEDIAEILRR
jgi:hypothetical protein